MTNVVLDSLSAQISAAQQDIEVALVAGAETSKLRKRLATLEQEKSDAQARYDAEQADAHAAAARTAEEDASGMVLEANADVNRALKAIGAELRLADDDQRFSAACRGG